MITVPSVGSMLAVIGVALLVTIVLSAIVGVVATCLARSHSAASPAGGTRVPDAPAPAPKPAPAVPGQRTRQPAGVG
jgi:hypothetical protein